jgi:hypothetical protein
VVSFTPLSLYPRGKSPRYPMERRLDPSAGLDDVERRKLLTLPGLELRPLGRPARNQSVYRLRYPGSMLSRIMTVLICKALTSMFRIPCKVILSLRLYTD